MNAIFLSDILLQLLSAGASVGRVYTTDRVIGRRWNLLALSSIGVDYTVNYLHQGRSLHLTGALVFGALSARTAMILALRLDGAGHRRQLARALISTSAWLACVAIVSLNQYRIGGIAPRTVAILTGPVNVAGLWYLLRHVTDPSVVALAGMGLGCVGESMGDMVRTRRCVLGMGLLMTVFAAATHNWGQLFKNAFADVTVTMISAVEYQDRPSA